MILDIDIVIQFDILVVCPKRNKEFLNLHSPILQSMEIKGKMKTISFRCEIVGCACKMELLATFFRSHGMVVVSYFKSTWITQT